MTRHIIITGANGSLGREIVKQFLEEDYHVIAVDHSGSRLGFAEGRSNFELHEVDLDKEENSEQFYREIISLKGYIDAAVFTVGGFMMGDIHDTNGEALKKMLNLNFGTAYFSARPVFRHMLERGEGRMVLIGAKPVNDPKAAKDVVAYALSKSLLFKLAEILNETASGKNIKVTVVAPGAMDTEPNRKNMPGAKLTPVVDVANEIRNLILAN